MLGSLVCVRCRRRLLQKVQQIRSIGFVSLNQAISQPSETFPEDRKPQPAYKQDGRSPDVAPRRRNKLPKRPLALSPGSSSGTDSVLENLFASNQRTKPLPPRLPYSKTPVAQSQIVPEPTDLRGPPIFEQLSAQFYKENASMQEVWKTCETLFARASKDEMTALCIGPMSRCASRLFKDLLLSVSRRNVEAGSEATLPRPHQVIGKYRDVGVMRDWWIYVLWPHLAAMVTLLYSSAGPGMKDNALETDVKSVRLMDEVLHVWSAFLERYGPRSPEPGDNQYETAANASPVRDELASFFPRFRHNQLMDGVLEACKVTQQCYQKMTEDRSLAFEIAPDGQRFVQLLDQIFKDRRISTGQTRQNLALEGVPDRIIDHFLNYSEGWRDKPIVYEQALLPSKFTSESRDPHVEGVSGAGQTIAELNRQEKKLARSIKHIASSLEIVQTNILIKAGEIRSPKLERQTIEWNSPGEHRAVTTIIMDLERAVEHYDVARVAAIWQRFQDSSLAKADLEPKSREQVYVSFLSSFFALSRPEQAVHVWNDMLQANITPNQRHWNSMLTGSSKARDVTSLQEIWSNMLTAGIEPDQRSWTTYINGLILCGKWQRGLQVLHDLGSRWKQASANQGTNARQQPMQDSSNSSTDKDASKPFLAPIKAAISALTTIERHEQCLPLLSWAAAHSLPLETDIFNTLLRPAVRRGDTEKVNHLFALMCAHHLPANETTYRILLNGHMSNTNSTFSSLPPQEQQDTILCILDDMDAKGIAVDGKMYSTILYGLLSPKNATYNDQAARAVLDHMSQRGQKPSTYIYSILVTYYFSLSPPNLPAVEALWRRMKTERPILDREFYERMIEGYARVREVERMLYFLRRIPHEGKAPGWRCIKVVLETLIECGEWGLCRELVGDVRDRKNGLRRWADDKLDSRAEGEFWEMVEGVRDWIQEGEAVTSG
ncbi:MAG: hypothetical protein Q9201_005936 [Fulgogasparrea decipioides]